MPNSLLRRGVTGALGLLLASSTLIGVAAGLAPATASVTQATGYVEICKVLAPAPNGVVINTAASFSYSIWSGETQVGSATVTAGFCSNEIAVPVASSGSTPITIAETQAPWYSVASITELAGQNYIKSGSINLATGSVTVNVGANANVDTVTYTNDPVTGYVEICKLATTGSGLTGTYAFTVTGADGFSSTAAGAVAVNGCSDPIAVPAGTVTVSEAGTNLYVTGITATLNGQTSTNWITNPSASNPDLTDGVVTVNVTPSLDTSKQTDVTYQQRRGLQALQVMGQRHNRAGWLVNGVPVHALCVWRRGTEHRPRHRQPDGWTVHEPSLVAAGNLRNRDRRNRARHQGREHRRHWC
jgi:hypothetical protein